MRLWILWTFLMPIASQATTLIWNQTSAVVGLNDRFGIYGEIQPRWNDHFHNLQVSILRTALLYRFDSRLRVGLGYAWAPQNLPRRRNENRIFQQVEWNPDLGSPPQWLYAIRGRFEQRFVEGVENPSYRLRARAEVAWMASAFGPYLWDEVFFDLNENPGFHVAGFEQNRLSVGARYRVSSEFRIEFGYLLRSLRLASTTVDTDSGVLLNVVLNFWK